MQLSVLESISYWKVYRQDCGSHEFRDLTLAHEAIVDEDERKTSQPEMPPVS